jgi:hypothetical protein
MTTTGSDADEKKLLWPDEAPRPAAPAPMIAIFISGGRDMGGASGE